MKCIKLFTVFALFFTLCPIVKSQSDNYNWGFKFGGSTFSNMINTGATNEWYGNSKGPEILVGIGFKNFYLNGSCRYFEEITMTDLPYNSPKGSSIRMAIATGSISYEHELGNRFFIEPSIGYLYNSTTSNIKDLKGNEFEIKDMNGIIVGSNIIKYVKFAKTAYLGLYLNVNYNFMNYQRINSGLTNNFLGYSIGVILKGTN